jgi:predicted metal-binding membrane protein
VAGGDRPIAPADNASLPILESLLLRDRFVVIAGLLVVIAAAWTWILLGAGTGMNASEGLSDTAGMSGMNGMSGMGSIAGMPSALAPAVWTPSYAGLILSMWWVMMIAMMLPSAAPMLLLFARMNLKERSGGRPSVPTAVFAGGYLSVWAGFGAATTALQWYLERIGLLSSTMATSSLWLGAAILVAAGAWQLTPIKSVCLRHCRSPLSFLSHSWRPGYLGAFRMGLGHGAYCLGCCWFLMSLLFFGGIMNLYWIIGLAIFILSEKTMPMGHWFGRIIGIGLVAWGGLLIATALQG